MDGHCVSCGAALDARLDWCSLCLTPVRSHGSAAAGAAPSAARFTGPGPAARGTGVLSPPRPPDAGAPPSSFRPGPPDPPGGPPPRSFTGPADAPPSSLSPPVGGPASALGAPSTALNPPVGVPATALNLPAAGRPGSFVPSPADATAPASFYRSTVLDPGMAKVDETAAQERSGRRRGVVLALAVIGINLVVQFCLQVFVGTLSAGAAVGVALGTGVAFYAGILLLARRAASWSRVRPLRSSGNVPLDVAVGVAAGGVTVAVVLGLQYVAVHRVIGDPTVVLLASRLSVLHVLTAVLLLVVAAPVVEEYVFRGVLLESWRSRSRRKALWLSAFLFALAHLRLAAVLYYTLCGRVLGRVYWRRGLAGSIAAHATFNGALVVAALLAVGNIHPPPAYINAGGYSSPTGSSPAPTASGSLPDGSASAPSGALPGPLPDPTAAPVTGAPTTPQVSVDPGEANAVATALWSGRNLAYHDRNPQALASYESGDILAADSITCNSGCPRPPVLALDSLMVDVPRQTGWPAHFLANAAYSQDCYADRFPCDDTFVAEQAAAGQPWKIVLFTSYSGHVVESYSGVGPQDFAPAPAVPSAARYSSLPAEYATYLSSLKTTGNPPAQTRLQPGPFTTALATSLHYPRGQGASEVVSYQAADSPVYAFSTSENTTTVCGAVSYTSVTHPAPGQLLVQPPDRGFFDSSLAPGSYSQVTTNGIHDACFVLDNADATGPVYVFASWGGPTHTAAVPAG